MAKIENRNVLLNGYVYLRSRSAIEWNWDCRRGDHQYTRWWWSDSCAEGSLAIATRTAAQSRRMRCWGGNGWNKKKLGTVPIRKTIRRTRRKDLPANPKSLLELDEIPSRFHRKTLVSSSCYTIPRDRSWMTRVLLVVISNCSAAVQLGISVTLFKFVQLSLHGCLRRLTPSKETPIS